MARLVKSIVNGSNVTGLGETTSSDQLEGRYAVAIGTLSDGATITPDFGANQNFTVTLGGNRALANPSNMVVGQTGSIFIVQDGTGSRTLSYGTSYDFAGGTAPTLSTGASAVDRIDYVVRTSTSIHCVFTANYS
tara:strand:- start:3590 stop:3994 length:405 start_codon:yes stop_codon:yes gene_type:complete